MQAFVFILPSLQGPRQSFPLRFLSWCIQWNHTSPKWHLHPKLTTLASGEPARIGICWKMTKPHLRTLNRVFLVNIMFSYSFSAIGSNFSLCSTCLDENGFGLVISGANLSWFLCLSLISWNLKAVNLYLCSFFQHSEFECSLVADSML